ncbi:MAG: DUF898 family protein [Thermodesulfobacteriota bacterium]
MVTIVCPNCGFSSDVPGNKIPKQAFKIKCLQCGQSFSLSSPAETSFSAKTVVMDSPVAPFAPKPPSVKTPLATHALSFHGNGVSLLKLYIVNNILSIITLGIYYFWGKTKIRQYLYSQLEFMGERFHYTGTGRELFSGWVKASFIFAVLFGAPNLLSEFVNPLYGFLAFPAFIFILPFAMVNARRYRMSRSLWHGVRFAFTGKVLESMKLYFITYLLTLLTLGGYSSFMHVRTQEFWRANTRVGNIPFSYDGNGRDVLLPYLLFIPLTFLTLGVYWFWFKAKMSRYDWEHTRFEGLKFKSIVTGRKLFGFYFVNLLIIIFTLGIGYPWVVARKIEFVCDNLIIEGAVDFEKILQTSQAVSATGEGLFEQFDMDFGIGI